MSDNRKIVKAYENNDFLKGGDARILRILSEYLEPQSRITEQKIKDTIVFFGSARIQPLEESKRRFDELMKRMESGVDKPGEEEINRASRAIRLSRYYEDASTLARLIVPWASALEGRGKRLVICSGGGPGIMEAANRGANAVGGKSIGLSISLPMEQSTNQYVPEDLAFEFHYFFMRKFWFTCMAKAVVIFPGGFGTLDEAFEVLTLVQTGKIREKMPILFYGEDYWKDILHLEALERWGMISPEDIDLIHFCDEPHQAFEILKREIERVYGQETVQK
jgi:uncharacterized protein (TIGR00730 family)